MHSKDFEHITKRYGLAADRFQPIATDKFSQVYEYKTRNQRLVLRISQCEHPSDIQDAQAMLAWMQHLASKDFPMIHPFPTSSGELLTYIKGMAGEYLAIMYTRGRGIRAEQLPVLIWDKQLMINFGRIVGKMHRIASTFPLQESDARRPDWDQMVNCFNPIVPLRRDQYAVYRKQLEVLDRIRQLPKTPDFYGMIHANLHCGNVLIDSENGAITLLGFEECCFGWYVMDIAMSLFDLLVLYEGFNRDGFAQYFLPNFVTGYRSEFELNEFWLRQLIDFLKLLEVSIYLMVYDLYDPEDRESWVGKFMPGRKIRIVNDLPYVNLKFADFSLESLAN